MVNKLLREEIHLGNFFNSIQIGILFIDENCNIESPNKAALDLFQYSKEILCQKKFTDLLTEVSKTSFIKHFKQLLHSNENIDSEIILLKVYNCAKQMISVELNINATLTDSDNIYIIVINDISERVRLRRELKAQKESNVEIEDQLHKEQELNELKSRFVTMASHEFRTPLAGVLSSINLIGRYLNDEEESGLVFKHKEKIETHFSKVRESVDNLNHLLNEFLSLGKLEEGKIQCQWEEIYLDELIKNVTSELKKLCKLGQQIKYINNLKKTTHVLDHTMIRNAVTNLLSNAIKYSEPGSEILLVAEDKDNTLKIEVKDEGIGIPEEDQPNLFGRFFRAKNATNIEGTGLGLNIVKRYIEMMGGNITFASVANKGTTFTILIPLRNEV